MDPRTRIENFLALIANDSDAQEIEPKTRDEYYLNEIAQRMNTNLLPETVDDDDGKLAVVFSDGSWKVQEYPFRITFTSGDGTSATVDKTANEIISAINRGLPIAFYVSYVAAGQRNITYLPNAIVQIFYHNVGTTVYSEYHLIANYYNVADPDAPEEEYDYVKAELELTRNESGGHDLTASVVAKYL